MKKKAFLSAAFIALALLTACSGSIGGAAVDLPKSANVTVTESDVEIWSTVATEKILQDKLDGYDAVKGGAAVGVFAARGEYEGAQLILTSEEEPVDGIDLTASELSLVGDGTVKFPKENIEVFFEKYLDVTKIYDANGAPIGKYPDALVPMQSIVDCGENKMKAGTNQGLYVRFNVPKDQPSGIYTGSLQLSFGTVKSVPVALEIADLTVSEETHSRSLFISEWQYRLGELDSTQAMLEKYIAAGLEYRISPSGVVIDDSYSDEGIQYYVDTAAKFMQDPKCTHIALPLLHKSQTRVIDGKSITANAVDAETMTKVLNAFIEKSLEDGFDYVKKLGTHLVDEPQLNKALDRTKLTTTIFKETLTAVADELQQRSVDNTEFRDTLVESVRNVRAIITASYDDDYVGYIDTWCPTVDYYDTEAQRAQYADQEEKWWYTCISPRAPFPTYHIEDTLLSARTMGWMQAEYDVVGNLFWATNVYANYDGSKYVHIEDFFEGDASRFSQVNGDGYLFYPGKPYGIDGPIGSLRLEAIRDGLEEYEILYELKNNYAAVAEQTGLNVNAANAINNLTTDLYAGTRVSTDSNRFDAARKALYSLAMMGNSDAQLAVLDYTDNGYGEITYEIYANDGYQLYNGETLLSPSSVLAGGGVYTVTNKLENDVNTVKLRLVRGEEEYVYEKDIGGKVTMYGAEAFVNAFKKDNSLVTATLIDAATVAAGTEGKFVKLDVEGTIKDSQRIQVHSEAFSSLTANSKKIVFRIYCTGLDESGLSFTLNVATSKNKYYSEVAGVTLHNGMNVVEMSLAALNFTKNGNVTFGLFTLGNDTNKTQAKTIYLKDVTVYNK